MAKFYIFEKKNLEKKIFRGRGDSPEPKNGGQILKNDFLREYSQGHFKTFWR